MPNQTMVYSCSGAEQEYTMVWFGIFLYLLISSLKIRFCEQSVFAKSPLLLNLCLWLRHRSGRRRWSPRCSRPRTMVLFRRWLRLQWHQVVDVQAGRNTEWWPISLDIWHN